MLQDLYYAFRLQAYNLPLLAVGKNEEDGKVELYLDDDNGEHPLRPFAENRDYDADVLRAVLSSANIGVGIELVYNLAHKILKGL